VRSSFDKSKVLAKAKPKVFDEQLSVDFSSSSAWTLAKLFDLKNR